MQKLQSERDELRRILDDFDSERSDMLGKFDQFGKILSEQHAS